MLRLAPAIFASVLSGTLLIPSIRPFLTQAYPNEEWLLHAFVAVALLGGVVVAPGLSAYVDRLGHRRQAGVALAVIDGLCLLGCAAAPSPGLLMVLRVIGGAANVAGLSILLSAVPALGPRGRAFGVASAATIAGVALGAPLGTLLLAAGPRAALIAGALLEAWVAVAIARLALPTDPEPRARSWALIRQAAMLKHASAWIFVERFVVGCFVVSFSLFAHQVHGLDDQQVGLLFTSFLVPFAVALYPIGRLADRYGRAPFVGVGLLAYGLCFLLLPAAPAVVLMGLLAAAGLASASLYGPALSCAGDGAPEGARSTVMAWVNAAGGFGMMLGTAAAGLVTSWLKGQGMGGEAYAAAFLFGGAAPLLVLIFSLSTLRRLAASDRQGLTRSARKG